MTHRNLLAIGFLALGPLAAGRHPAGAATFTVDETVDKPDKKPGDGRCNVEGLFTRDDRRRVRGDAAGNARRFGGGQRNGDRDADDVAEELARTPRRVPSIDVVS